MNVTGINTSALSGAQLDQSAVAAVRGGNAERYRELVERHERRVYAVAWSRLGDATLAEEVTQEVFIRAYRRLWLLGDGAKFSGWVNTIARRLAINFGLRHRRELNKRERWALEHSVVSAGEHATADSDLLHPPETLRQALAELSPAHRECLVLFYLEGKSGVEAAAALGVSEAALRVRLHRARAALRERLEDKLAYSLTKLGPACSLVPAVMVGVLSTSSAQAAAGGVGTAVAGALSKWIFLKWLAGAGMNLFFLPALALNWLFMRLDLNNFRDRDGFRARLFLQNTWLIIWVMTVFVAGIWISQTVLSRGQVVPSRTALSIPAAILLLLSLRMARRLRVVWNRYFASVVAANLLTGTFVLALVQGWIPILWVGYFVVLQAVAQMVFFAERPLRTDYNLFLRAVENILPADEVGIPAPPENFQATGVDLFRFARFLGGRWLVSEFRHTDQGLSLQLTPLKSTFQSLVWNLMFLFFRRTASNLLLQADGVAIATLNSGDLNLLRRVSRQNFLGKEELEARVGTAVTLAWRQFRSGDSVAAERALGQVPDADVFVQPVRKTWSTQLQRAFAIGVAGFVAIQMFYVNDLTKSLGGMTLSTADFSQQQYRRARQALLKAQTAEQRFYALGDAAKRSFEVGNWEDARSFARELMTLIPAYRSSGNYGTAVQDANLVLGRLALREGKTAEAKKYLIDSSRSHGSPTLNSFGPNMSLALDFLEKGEGDVVLEYFMRCRKFWTFHPEKLALWIQTVQAGKTPDFGANLLY